MVVVLDSLASYIQKMLTDMVKQEVHMLLGVPNEIDKMTIKLRDLKKFLADADRRNITDESVQTWVKDLRGAMYDATNIVDLCHLKAMEQGPSWDIGCFNPLLFCMRNPIHAHDIGRCIKNLNNKLNDIEKRGMAFKFVELTSYEDHGRHIESSRRFNRETTGELNKFGLVGDKIEEDTRNLVELLTREEKETHEHKKIKVFAIVGVGGIGKTTLAQKIFDNDIIKQKFSKKIWLSVNQEDSENELLRRTIEALGCNYVGNTKVAQVQTLKEALEGCKTLVVMDDVWNHRAWKNVLKTPLTNALVQGSCVLLTTRDSRVARGMMAEEPYYHVDRLGHEDCWSLLKKQVVGNVNDESQVEMLKDIGMKIVAKCDGLPLAVKVMGGLLRQKKERRSDWVNVLNESTWSVSQMPEELNYIIYLSYQDLHPSLKPCFLHLSLLPKSELFNIHEIVGMWISEGYIHGDSQNLEELGKEYYDELILRNLTEPNLEYIDQTVCTMHDVVRSFAQYVARDEAVVSHNGQMNITDKHSSKKLLRLSLDTKGSESINELEWMSLQAQASLRTLVWIGHIMVRPGISLLSFSSLRTLHVKGIDFDALAESLVKFRHLRYLTIENTNVSRLPEDICRLRFLQFISVSYCQNLVKLPVSVGKLMNLRFLALIGTNIKYVPRGLKCLTNLRKLYGFPADTDGDWCSLEELGPLCNLIRLSISGLENVCSSLFARKAKLGEKARLSYLDLTCKSNHGNEGIFHNISDQRKQQLKEVFDELCPPPCLEELTIRGYFGRQLPRWMMSTVAAPLQNLRFLIIKSLPYCTELPDGLCQLPCLEFLHVEHVPYIVRIGPEFIQHHHHDEHVSALENLGSANNIQVVKCPGLERIGNLPKTQKLGIIMCPKLKVLEGVPALQRLRLVDYNMQTLPNYLQDLNPRILHVDCDLSLLTSVALGKSGPEWNKFSHIQEVKVFANDDDNNIERKWYMLYTKDPFSFRTNISPSTIVLARWQRMERLWLSYDTTCPVEEEWPVGRTHADKHRPFSQKLY